MLSRLAQLLALAVVVAMPVGAVSVLSHEEMIDVTWESDILPLLTARFPDATPEQLKKAHAFAYGGSVIQDVGYYPLGNKFFTDLLHYVRSGDFVLFMLRDARDLNEYAFALGALSHYAADSWGHQAVNVAEPILYPKLRRKFGNVITYEDNHEAHLRTEFSFDVLEVAKHRYRGQQYHDFIGFDVSEDLMERAFQDTYGLPMDDLLHYDDLTLETFRFSVAKVIPEMTEVALATNRPRVKHEKADPAKQEFVFHLSRADYEKQYGNKYRRPGIFARILGFLIKLLPFGPAKVLGYRNPTPQSEDYYFRSMDQAIDNYRKTLRQVKDATLKVPNRNFDTGQLTRAGEYKLCDRTYADLVRDLAKDHFRHLTPGAKENLLAFFSAGRPEKSISAKDWKKLETALERLKSASPTNDKESQNSPASTP
jgi:hypothetical protein